MAKKVPFRTHVGLSSDGSTLFYLKTDPVESGRIYCVQNCSFLNENSAMTYARGYIEGHGYKHYIWEQVSPTADTLYWYTDDFYLTERERFVIEFKGSTSGDKLHMYLTGYWMCTSEGAFYNPKGGK